MGPGQNRIQVSSRTTPIHSSSIHTEERIWNLPESYGRSSSNYKRQYALVYMEDVFIFSEIPEEHTSHIREVVTLSNKDGDIHNL